MSTEGDRLDRSRLAILEHVHRKERRREVQDQHVEAAKAGEGPRGRESGGRHHAGWYDKGRDVVEAWWRYHPAHVALDIARPALAAYARRKPMQYLGLSALAGAGLFMLRPWKLISVTGVLVALVKSPQVAGLVMSAMSSSQNPADDPPVSE